MNKLTKTLISTAALCFATNASAALLHFDGYISDYDDVVVTQFNVASTQTVSAWTDSFQSAANFDPITTLWDASGNYITHNDDNSSIAAGQTWYDSGIVTTLAAGTYYFSISVYNNFANSSANILTGNPFDGGCGGCTSGPGLYYSQWFSGVSSASVVPEPATLALLGLGLVGLGFGRKNLLKS